MTTPTTTSRSRRKKPLRPAKDKTPLKPVEAVEVVPEASSLADFVVPEFGDDHDDEDAPVHVDDIAEQVAEQVELIGQDAFFTVFKTTFDVPQFIQSDFAVVAVHPDEQAAARAASDATYGLLKIYYPAALTPKGAVFGHLMIAGPFLLAKVMIVREIIRARRAKPANPPEPPTRPAADGMTAVEMDAVVIPMEQAA